MNRLFERVFIIATGAGPGILEGGGGGQGPREGRLVGIFKLTIKQGLTP